MNFELTEDQKMLRDMVQRFGEAELSTSTSSDDHQGRLSASTVAQLKDLGLLGLAEDGGDLAFAAVALYELARRDTAAALFVADHCAAYAALDTCGQAAGAVFALPHVAEVQLDEVNGEVQATARLSVPFLDHISAFVMRVGLPGHAGLVRASAHLLGETRAHEMLGLHGVRYESAVLNANVDVVGGQVAVATLSAWHTVALAAILAGIARAGYSEGLKYAQERRQFGKALVEFQATQFKLADMATRADAAWLGVVRAACASDVSGQYALGRQAVAYAKQAAKLCTDEGLQLHGGYGYTREYPIERLYRDARALAAISG